MTERFNVGGAMLLKLFGRRGEEDDLFADRAANVRDLGVRISLITRIFGASMMLVPALATALVYGFGGHLAIDKTLTVGTLLALGHPAAPPARSAAGPLQRPDRRDDRAGQLRAGLRGARPAVADPGEAGRRRRFPAAPLAGVRARLVHLPAGRRDLPGLARERRPHRVAGQRPGALRRQLRRRARPDGGAGRPVRRRQDHGDPPGRPALRRGVGRRSGSAATTYAM